MFCGMIEVKDLDRSLLFGGTPGDRQLITAAQIISGFFQLVSSVYILERYYVQSKS